MISTPDRRLGRAEDPRPWKRNGAHAAPSSGSGPRAGRHVGRLVSVSVRSAYDPRRVASASRQDSIAFLRSAMKSRKKRRLCSVAVDRRGDLAGASQMVEESRARSVRRPGTGSARRSDADRRGSAAFLIRMRPPRVKSRPWRPLRAGRTQSNRSTPARHRVQQVGGRSDPHQVARASRPAAPARSIRPRLAARSIGSPTETPPIA